MLLFVPTDVSLTLAITCLNFINRLQDYCTDLYEKNARLFNEYIPKLTVLSEKVLQEVLEFQNSCLYLFIVPQDPSFTYTENATDMPTIVSEEKENETTRYLSMTTIATFFSTITATTLQISVQNSGNGLGRSVNLLWLLSLAFSIASGINSLLGMTWKRTTWVSIVRPVIQ